MLKARSLVACSIVAGLIFGATFQAAIAGEEFSAESVQKGPQGEVSGGKMYVGTDRMRTETTQGDQRMVHIRDNTKMVEWILFPDQHSYMERRGQPQAQSKMPAKKTGADDPCADMPGVTCTKLGTETLSGRSAVKWRMSFAHQGEQMQSTQWIDEERGVPLRQEMPNGQVTELLFVGQEELEGRPVEKWEMVTSLPNQTPTRTFQWYDPQLEIAVKQEYPGGYVSALKNIRVGKQPDDLFAVPAGYKRVEQPQGTDQIQQQMPGTQ